MTAELFSADRATTTVSAGGTDAPADGTAETWTVASSAMFGAASTGLSQFHVADPAAPSEVIAVTNVSGTTWTVTRGAENTTPVAHSAGFTVYQVATAGFLGSIALPVYPVPPPAGATATDTPAITAVIASLNAAGGHGTLLFRDGTYQVDSNALVIRSCSNFTVQSTGATVITQAPNRAGLVNNVTGDLFVIADCTDFRVDGITFDGLRDTLAPMTPLTASASSGQPSVTVASGNGARYLAGQNLFLFGGLGTIEQNQAEGFGVGSGTPLVVSSITAGGGVGGGDLITFTTNLASSYAQISSTPFSDGFGPYAYAGAYLTPYQCGKNNIVAGRTLSGEDQQCGLHLISCSRFAVSRVEARNLWESPVKLGTGEASTSLTDGCSQGTVTACTGYHAYDQGVSVWVSTGITVTGCVLNAAGWAGVSLTGSSYCSVTGCQILNSVYRVPGDDASGCGIAIEGGLRNQVAANIITSPYRLGLQAIQAPAALGIAGTLPTTSTFLEAGTAAGTSVQVSSSAALRAGALYSLLDGPNTEPVTVVTAADGTHVTFAEKLSYSHPSGIGIGCRVAQENVFDGNTVQGAGSQGILLVPSVRTVLKGNVVTGTAGVSIAADYTTGFRPTTAYPAGDGSHLEGNVIGNGAGAGIKANGVSRLLIRGNKVYSPNGNGGAIELHGVTDTVVSGNEITDVVGSSGISAVTGGPSSIPCARITITGNSIHRTQLQGIVLTLGDSYTVTGNVVWSCRNNGIDLLGVTNSAVTANMCVSNSATGIVLENSSSTGCSGCRVTGNTTRDDGTGLSVVNGASITQQHGIVESGNSNSNLFMGNETDSNAIDQLTIVGAGSVTHYNIISGTISS